MATKANISIDQGSTFTTQISLTDASGNPLDLTAYTAQAEIRTSYASINAVSFDVALSNGQVTLSLNSTATGQLTRSRYVYDVILTDSSNNITRVLEGVVYVDPWTTRPNTTPTYYTMYLANVQNSILTGDRVYQSNGSANVTGTVYWTEGPQLLGYGAAGFWDDIGGDPVSQSSNVMIIKVSNPSGTFITTSNNNSYLINDANTNANAIVMSVTQTVTE